MTTELFAGELPVHYGFAHVLTEARGVGADLTDARRGQVNGLLGAAVPHQLLLTTGLHTGSVAFAVTWSEAEPAIADEWEDVVEASLDVAATSAHLTSFQDAFPLALPATGPHRARFHATGFDAGSEADTAGPGPDRYLLQLWPAALEPDRIVRETSSGAAYWHRTARELPAVAPAVERPERPTFEYVEVEPGRYALVETSRPSRDGRST